MAEQEEKHGREEEFTFPNLRFCASCGGKREPPNAKHCAWCGYAFGGGPVPPAQYVQPFQQQQPQQRSHRASAPPTQRTLVRPLGP